ncbi:M15 family metallopeptidase [uncultured Deefgea sp.]|uniref:M15 family metallopeptidase n=1 Tax=uncultured Deefgea sp. TaxID=1304914 RepID=UPI002612E125|nr:M15 family metallopeptidase [uncultured Deefgea sp.]
MNTLLIVFLILLFCLLAWIGWHFFVATPSKEISSMAVEPPAHLPKKILADDVVADSVSVGSRRLLLSGLKLARVPVASFLLIVMVVLVTLKFNTLHVLAPFLPQQYGQTAHIQNTLTEAKLAPPPALPPEVFINATRSQPSLAGANRDWQQLESRFVQQVLQVMKKMDERGYPLALLEGYRSPERQDELAQMANLVTKAKGGQSKHQYGWAVDLAPIKNGKVIISEKDPWASEAYQALGEEAEAAGLTWGGRWSFKDYGHIEKTGSLAVLLQKNK